MVARRLIRAAVLAGLCVAGGCTTEQKSDVRRPESVGRPGGAAAAPETKGGGEDKLPPEILAIVDPCAQRLEDVAGALLDYYRVHSEFPPSLAELQAAPAPGGAPLVLTCPVSRQPYRYTPAGLQSLGRAKRIVVSDPTPAHDGSRWCVFYSEGKGEKAPPYLEVLPVKEGDYETYLPVSEHIAPQ